MASIAAPLTLDCQSSKSARWSYPLVIIHKAAPVPHLQHGFKAEHWLLVQAATLWYCQSASSQLDWLISLSPCKLLLPDLYADVQAIYIIICLMCKDI